MPEMLRGAFAGGGAGGVGESQLSEYSDGLLPQGGHHTPEQKQHGQFVCLWQIRGDVSVTGGQIDSVVFATARDVRPGAGDHRNILTTAR